MPGTLLYNDRPNIGQPPVATSLAFRAWVDAYHADRVSLIPDSAAATHFYFSSSTGADSNSGSINSPFQTMAKLQAKLNGWTNPTGGSLYLRRLCGDEWNQDLDSRLNFNGLRNVVVTDYGDRSKGLPHSTRWKAPVAFSALHTSIDRGDGFTNTLSWTDGDFAGTPEIVCVRDQGAKAYAYKFNSTIDKVNNEPGSCIRVGTTFYLHPFTRSTYLQSVEFLTVDLQPTTPFFGTSDVGWGPVWIMNQTASGCGVVRYGTEAGVNAKAAYWFGGGTGDFLGMVNAESLYYSRHGIVTATPTAHAATSGVIQFLDRCRVGWSTAGDDSSGTVADCQNGLTEFAAFDCECVGGKIQRPGLTPGGGVGYTSHANSGAGIYTLLDLIVRLHVRPTSGNVSSPAGYADPQTLTNLASAQAFIIDCDVPQRDLDEHDAYVEADNSWTGCAFLDTDPSTVVVGGQFWSTLVSTKFDGTGRTANSNEQQSQSGISGLYFNSRHVIDVRRSKVGKTGLFPTACILQGASSWSPSLYNCTLDLFIGGGAHAGFLGQQYGNNLFPDPSSKTVNCLQRVFGGTASTPGFYVGNATKNAYFNVATKYLGSTLPGADYVTLDPTGVVLASDGGNGDDPDLALGTDTLVTVGGVTTVLEFDALGFARSGRNAIGPYRSADTADPTLPPAVVGSASWKTPGDWQTALRPTAASQTVRPASKTQGGDFFVGLDASSLLEVAAGATVTRAACTCGGATVGACIGSVDGKAVEAEFTAFTVAGTYAILWDIVLSDGTRHRFPGSLVVTAS